MKVVDSIRYKLGEFVGFPASPVRVLILLSGFTFIIATIGGVITRFRIDWYHSLNQTVLVPPDWAFGPMWTIMFILLTAGAWLTWRRLGWPAAKVPITIWVVQMCLNALWTIIFFGFGWLWIAFIESLLLTASAWLTTKAFFAGDRLAGWLTVPVCIWVSYASLLSLSMALVN